MKIRPSSLVLLPLASALLSLPVIAQKPDAGPARAPGWSEAMPHRAMPPMEKVTFLGVETRPMDPALAAQLGLPRDFGLVVTTVVPDSPAAGALRDYDILLKFQDQQLVDSHQLAALVRARKPGDTVGLTVVRKGREQTVQVKLGEHAMPRMLWGDHEFRRFPREAFAGPMWAYPRRDADQVFALIHGDHDPAHTRIIMRREGFSPRASVMDLGHSTIVYNDEHGTLELTMDNGKKQLVAKDKSGKILFSGPINTEEERRAVPAGIMARLRLIEKPHNFGFHAFPDGPGGGPMMAPDGGRPGDAAGGESSRPM